MGREIIGSVTEWEAGWETDMAYEMAMTFLDAALGNPPPGVTIEIVDQDHDFGSYPVLAVCWLEFGEEPWGFIRRAETALATFCDAVDWSRIRPGLFVVDTEDDPEDEDDDAEHVAFTPEAYLDHLADSFCAAVQGWADDDKAVWRGELRDRARDMDIDDVRVNDTSFEGYARAILSPDNHGALHWARRCVDLRRAQPADPDDPCTVIDRLHWPTEPGCRARED